MQLKQQSLENQMSHPFSLAYYDIQQKVMTYAQLMTIPKNDLKKPDVTKMIMCTESNIGTRKVEVLDKKIKYYTYADFVRLRSDDLIKQKVFIGEKGLNVETSDDIFK